MSFPSNVISGSVGFGGSNRKSDVQLIQSMLNAVGCGSFETTACAQQFGS